MNLNFFRTCRQFTFLAAALTVPLASQAAAFTNGDFEAPGLAGSAQIDVTNAATAPTGWTPGGTLGNFSLFYQDERAFGVLGIAGRSSVGFGGNGNTGATLSQTFDTLIGQSYTVNYFVTSQQGQGAVLQTERVEAFNGAASLGSNTGSIPTLVGAEVFHWYAGPSLTFLATGLTSTLRFTDTSSASATGCCNWALDGVTVSGQVAAIPEPSTYGLMLAGLGMVGFFARRKTRS